MVTPLIDEMKHNTDTTICKLILKPEPKQPVKLNSAGTHCIAGAGHSEYKTNAEDKHKIVLLVGAHTGQDERS